MHDRPPDLAILTKALNDAGVRYVLIGGMALVLHGGTAVTYDGDFAVALDADNRHRLVEALAQFEPKPIRLANGANWVWDELSIRSPWTVLDTSVGRIDLIVRLPGVDSFDGLFGRSVLMVIDDLAIRVASLQDLISMKRSSERPKDRLHLLELEAIRDVSQREEP